jgi:hypothetical protein
VCVRACVWAREGDTGRRGGADQDEAEEQRFREQQAQLHTVSEGGQWQGRERARAGGCKYARNGGGK